VTPERTWFAVALGVFCAGLLTMCALHSASLSRPPRIDWDAVPGPTPYQLSEHTQAELAFARERKRMYAALRFERSRVPDEQL
jgi:hypothetical protein